MARYAQLTQLLEDDDSGDDADEKDHNEEDAPRIVVRDSRDLLRSVKDHDCERLVLATPRGEHLTADILSHAIGIEGVKHLRVTDASRGSGVPKTVYTDATNRGMRLASTLETLVVDSVSGTLFVTSNWPLGPLPTRLRSVTIRVSSRRAIKNILALHCTYFLEAVSQSIANGPQADSRHMIIVLLVESQDGSVPDISWCLIKHALGKPNITLRARAVGKHATPSTQRLLAALSRSRLQQ